MLGIQSYKIQKGVLPLVLTIVGGLIILFSMGIAFVFFAPSIFLNKIVLPNDFNQNWLIYLSAIPLNLLGGYLISIFPLIKLSPQGIVLKGFYLSQTIKWNEVIDLVESKSGTVLILVDRKGFYLLNGLLFQRITGLVLNHKQPVILIYLGLQKNNQLLEDIKKNLIS